MTDDELTVLMIAATGESMIPIGRWKEPIEALTRRGMMRAANDMNYVITEAGCKAVRDEESSRDQDFAKALRPSIPDTLKVDLTIKERNIKFDLTYDPNFIADICTYSFMHKDGCCEPEVAHLMRRVVRPGDFVIDGGANIGFFTLLLSRLVGEQGHVEAFEPAVVNFNKLRRNLQLNRIENVTAINRALWNEQADLMLYIAADTGLSCVAPFEHVVTTLPVKAITLDRWCLNYDQRPRLLKLDIEGAEEQALLGATGMLAKGIDFIVCEINSIALSRFGSSQYDLRGLMQRKGYEMFTLHENGDEPTPVDPMASVEGPQNFNVLFSTQAKVREAWEVIF